MSVPLLPTTDGVELLLVRDYIPVDPKIEAQLKYQATLRNEIATVLTLIEDRELREIVQNILGELLRFFGWLDRIESNLQELDTLRECLSILEMLQMEAHSLIEFIETKAMPSAVISNKLRDILDGINYGFNHDLRRIFEREQISAVTGHTTPIVYGKILHAHGLLTNCLQQSTITLLQVFHPAVDSATLFDDAELRLKQSLLLCRDLSALMALVKRALAHPDPNILRRVVTKVIEFRDSTMHFLMYKDWRGYERLGLEVVTSIENNLNVQPLLHQFLCYLEILYGHVKMRAVLSNIFPYSSADEEG